MPTLVPVDNDPFAPSAPKPSPKLDALRANAGQIQQQLDNINQMLEGYRATRQPAGAQQPAQRASGPTLTPVDHDPFAAGPLQSFTLPGGSAGAMVDPRAPQPQQPPMSSAARAFQADQEYQIAARQSTDLTVRDPKGNFTRPVLGRAYQLDDGNVYFDGPDGRPVQADKAKHVVLRDPQTGQQLVFARTADTDQNKLLSLGQMLAPGMATNPLTGVGRGSGLTNAARTSQQLSEVRRDAAAFDRLGVRPFGPAFASGPVGATAKQITEVPMLGAPTRNALEESLTGTRDAARNVAGRYGPSTTAREAGDVAQQGITRFKDARPADVVDDAIRNLPDQQLSQIIAQPSNATSLKSKQAALYERAWRLVPTEMQQGRAVEGLTRVMQSPANTRAVLTEIMGRNRRMTVQSGAGAVPDSAVRPVTGGLLGRMIDAVNNPHWTANLQTLRDMRSEFRRLASGMTDTERNTLRLSDLERIQSGLTEDMVGLLQRNAQAYRSAGDIATAQGFERSIREFRRADRFTRLSMERLRTIERLFKADSAESLARSITSAALSGGRGNEQMLQTLRRTLQPDEMADVAAAIISEMGRPTGSARGHTQAIGFSVGAFLSKWQNMSPGAKARLFNGPHREALDDLVRVASRLANVEALANTSRSFSNTLGVGSLGAAGAAVAAGADAMFTAGATAGAIAGASVLFSRPSYVRWVTGYLRAKEAARNPQAMGRVAAAVNQLGRLAQSDPALLPIFRSIARENGVGQEAKPQHQQEHGARGIEPEQNPERQLQMPTHGPQATPPAWPAPMRLGGPVPNQQPAQMPSAPFGMPQMALPPPAGWQNDKATTWLAPGAELRNGPPVGMRDRMADWLGSAIGGDAQHARSNYQAADALSLLPFIGGPMAGFEGGQMIGSGLNAASPATVAGGAALAGLGPFGMLRRGGGAAKGVQEEIAKLEAELTQLAAQTRNPRLAQSLTRVMERPRPVPGTSKDELRRYDVAYRDTLRKKIADERQAIQNARHSMPRTAVPTPLSSPSLTSALSMSAKVAGNPFVQAIPGQRGFPTKASQKAAAELAKLNAFGGAAPMQGPWTMPKPVDPLAMTRAESELLGRAMDEMKALEVAKRRPPPKS